MIFFISFKDDEPLDFKFATETFADKETKNYMKTGKYRMKNIVVFYFFKVYNMSLIIYSQVALSIVKII